MRVVITGATGFIGRNLATCLHDEGMAVRATGRNPAVGAALEQHGIAFRPADLLHPDQLEAAFVPSDCVIHCAGKPGDRGSAAAFDAVNVQGTRNVIRACERHGIRRIVFISTPSVYFSGRHRLGITEDEPLPPRPLTHYARTKLLAEEELLAWSERGRQVIILRPRAVYGPHDNTVVPRILALARKPRLPLIGGGQALTDITYIDNLVDAVRLGLQAPEDSWNAVYNISNGEPISIRDWFAAVLESFGKPFAPRHVPVAVARAMAWLMETASRLPFGPAYPAFTRFSVGYMACSMTMSIDRARTRLGYSPRISNREGFERHARWFHAGSADQCSCSSGCRGGGGSGV